METAIFTAEKYQEIVVVEVHGDVDCGACGLDRLCGLLHNLVDSGDHWMVLDLRHAGEVHERAMAEMLAVLGRLRLVDGGMILVASPGKLLRRLRKMGFHELTLVLDDVNAATEQAALRAGVISE